MSAKELMEFFDSNNIEYRYEDVNGTEMVRAIFKPVDYTDFCGNKRKFTPYLRVSHFGEREGMLYVRDCGDCNWQTEQWVKERAIKMSKEE